MAGSCITPVFPRKRRPLTGSTAPPPEPRPTRRTATEQIPGSLAPGGTRGARRRVWLLRRIVGIFGRLVGIGVLSLVALALRPESSTPARMPPTARSAPRGGRQGLLDLTAGLAGGGRRYRALSRCIGGSVTTECDRSGGESLVLPCGSKARDGHGIRGRTPRPDDIPSTDGSGLSIRHECRM
jgi:hypothetical protein